MTNWLNMMKSESSEYHVLARHMALIRLLSLGVKRDADQFKPDKNNTIYILDTNVAIYLADPLTNSHLMSVFKNHSTLKLPAHIKLNRREQNFIHAFALSESESIPQLLRSCSTHMLRPHLIETNWRRIRMARRIQSDLESFEDEERDRERNIAETITEVVRDDSDDANPNRAKSFFEIFLKNYQDSIIKKVHSIERLNRIVKSNILVNKDARHWEQRSKPEKELWSFFYYKLLEYKGQVRDQTEVFKIIQDAEALSLVCQYSHHSSINCLFLTFDWSIIKLLLDIYTNSQRLEIPDDIRHKLPKYNFVRHPLALSRFVRRADTTLENFRINDFIEEIDSFFDIKEDSPSYKNDLMSIAFEGEFRSSRAFGNEDQLLRRIENDLLFVHEESAVSAFANLIEREGIENTKSWTHNVETNKLTEICNLINEHLDARSSKKNAELCQSFLILPIVDRGRSLSQHELVDEAIIILTELGKTEVSLTKRAPKQLLRNWPGWLKFTENQISILLNMRDRTDEVLNNLSKLPEAGDPELWLVIAVITAVKGNWILSERHAKLAYYYADQNGEIELAAESLYWRAVSIHYQTHPTIARLNQARSLLENAIKLNRRNKKQTLKYETERLWIDVFIPIHNEIYGESYRYDKSSKNYEDLYNRALEIESFFVKTAPQPLNPIDIRLGIHIYSCLCFLDLTSLGLQPGFEKVDKRNTDILRKHHTAIRWFVDNSHITIPIRVRFFELAMQYLETPIEQTFDEIRSFLTSDEETLIPFDRAMINYFLSAVK